MNLEEYTEALDKSVNPYQGSNSTNSSTSAMMTMFTTTFLVLMASTMSIFFFSTFYCFSISMKTRLRGLPPLPPGSLGLPIIGESLSFLSDPTSFITSRHAKYGRMFKSNVFGTTVFRESPAGNKFLFANEGKLVQMSTVSSIRTLMGPTAMLFKVGDSHKLARRHMAPFLQPSALAQYVPRIERHTINHFEKFWQPSLINPNNEEFEIPVVKWSQKLAYYIMADLAMTLEASETEDLLKLHQVWARGLLQIPVNFPGSTYNRALKARASLLAVFEKIIARRRVDLAEGKASPTQDFLSYLLTEPDENGKLCTDEEVKDNVLLLLAAGHDTTASVIAMTLRFISMYPDVQHRLKEEHDAVARRKDDGNKLTRDDVWGMKYTWSVIQESLRWYPAARMGFKEASRDFEYDGFTIMKGWKLLWSTHFHMDPKCFKDPEKFDPTRFNGESQIIPYSYLPFGSGPHVCLGKDFAKLESIIIIYHVMRNYSFTLVDPDESVIYDALPTQKSGMLMRVKKLLPETF